MADEYGAFEAVEDVADEYGAFEAVDGPDEYAGFESMEPAPEPEAADPAEEEGITWEDHGRSIMSGGAEVGAGMGWLAERAGQAIGSEGLESVGTSLRETSQESADWWKSGISDYANEVNQQEFLADDPSSWTGYKMGDAGFEKVGLMLSQSLLGTAAGMGAGMGATAALKVLPGVSAGVAATLGYSGGEALVAAPSAGAQAEDEVNQMSVEDLAGHVEFESLLLTDIDPEKAKEMLARAAGGDAAIMTAISTAVLSSPFGKYLDKIVGGEGSSMLGGMVKGAATETVQEGVQSGAEQVSVNAAILKNAQAGRELMEGVPEAVVGGMAAGGAMGGAMGLGGGIAESKRLKAQDGLDRAAAEAAEAAIARGGDELDAQIAEQQVYTAGEFDIAMDPEYQPPAEGSEDITYNPFQQTMQPIEIGGKADDGFAQDNMLPYSAPEAGGGLELVPQGQEAPLNQDQAPSVDFYGDETDTKAAGIEAQIEQKTYDDLGPGPGPSPVIGDQEQGEAGPSARQEQEESAVRDLEKDYKAAKKGYVNRQTTGSKSDPAKMELAQWIVAENGPMDIDEARAQGIDEADLKKTVGGKRLFKEGGDSFDHVAESASQFDWFAPGEEVSPNTLLDKLTRSLGGEEVYTPAGQEDEGARQYAQQEMDSIQQRMEEYQTNYDSELDEPLPAFRDVDEPKMVLSQRVDEAEALGVPESEIDQILDTAKTPEEASERIAKEITLEKEYQQWLTSPSGDARAPEESEAPAQGPGTQEAEAADADTGSVDFELTPYVEGEEAPAEPEPEAEAQVDNTATFMQQQIDVDDSLELEFAEPQKPKTEEAQKPNVEDDGFTLEVVEQDNVKETNMVDYTPADDRQGEHARISEKLKDTKPKELAKMLVSANVDPTGMTNEEMIQRVNMVQDAMREMAKYESVVSWDEALTDSSHAEKQRIRQWADMVDPAKARDRSAEGYTHNTAVIASRIKFDGKGNLPRYTAEQQTAQDKKEAAGHESFETDQAEIASRKKVIEEYMTAERGKEVSSWWDGASPIDREAFLDVLGFKNDKRKKTWVNRQWSDTQKADGKTKRGVPSEAKGYAEQYLVTFWDQFKENPQAFVDGRTMPSTLPSLSQDLTNLGKINAAVEQGVLVSELSEIEGSYERHPARKMGRAYTAARDDYHEDRFQFLGMSPKALASRYSIEEKDGALLNDYFANFYEKAGMRAAPGGEEGANGRWYKGGQLLPGTEELKVHDEPIEFVDPKTPYAGVPQDPTITFGKYKGQDIREVAKEDPGYVSWMAEGGVYKDHPALRSYLDTIKKTKEEGKAEEKKKLLDRKVDVDTVLKAAGLKLERDGDKWLMKGNTYPFRGSMNEAGGKFDRDLKAYVFSENPNQVVAALISDEEGTGVNLDLVAPGAKEDKKRAKEMRKRLDATKSVKPSPKSLEQMVSAATQTLIERGKKFGMSATVVREQVEDAGQIKWAYENDKPMFMLASEAGSGKTFVLGAAMREIKQANPKAKFAYVTMNKNLITQIQDDLIDYDISDVEFYTYDTLSSRTKTVDVDSETVLIFDEAHNVKNIGNAGDGSARAAKAQGLMEDSKMTVFASATPYENPVEMKYLEATGVFDSAEDFTQFVLAHGAGQKIVPISVRGRLENTVVPFWPGGRHLKKHAAAAREWVDKQGMFTQRRKRLPEGMVDSSFKPVKVERHYVEMFDNVTKAYEEAQNALGGNNSILAMHLMNVQKRILEASKVQAAIKEAEAALAAGEQAVIFVETKSERNIANTIPFQQMAEDMEEWRLTGKDGKPPHARWKMELARSFEANNINYPLASTVDEIYGHFGKEKTAVYVGSKKFDTVSVTEKTARDGLAAFKANEKPVLIATMAKGGTGLSLHPTEAGNPRTQIGLNLPWKATGVDQVSGRLARYGMQSKVKINWLFAGDIPVEEKIARRVGDRMAAMGATVSGLELEAAEALQDWDFEGQQEVGGTEQVVKKPATQEAAPDEEVDADPEAGLSEDQTKLRRLSKRLDVLDQVLGCLIS